MSWQDNIKTRFQLKIPRGDGMYTTFKPNWVLENRDTDYNYSEVELIGIDGTYVPRQKVKGRRGTIKFHFTGADCFEKAQELLEASNKTQDAWVILHPFDGYMTIQPTKIAEKRNLNNIEFNVKYIETIILEDIYVFWERDLILDTSKYPVLVEDVNTTNIDNSALTQFLEGMEDVMDGYDNILAGITEYREIIADVKDRIQEVTANIFALLNFNNVINSLMLDVLRTICIIQTDVSSKLEGLRTSILTNKKLLNFYTDAVTKHIFETSMTTAMAQACKMSIGDNIPYSIDGVGEQNITDKIATIFGGDNEIDGVVLTEKTNKVKTKQDVVDITDNLTSTFEDYVASLEALNETGADYQYSHTTLEYIYGMYINAIIQANKQLLDSKIEYSVTVDYDTNLILWCNDKFGNCDNLDEIIEYNKDVLHRDSYTIIKKGQEIKYLM